MADQDGQWRRYASKQMEIANALLVQMANQLPNVTGIRHSNAFLNISCWLSSIIHEAQLLLVTDERPG